MSYSYVDIYIYIDTTGEPSTCLGKYIYIPQENPVHVLFLGKYTYTYRYYRRIQYMSYSYVNIYIDTTGEPSTFLIIR